MPEPCKSKEINDRKYRCFFELTLGIIGGKWKPVILFHIAVEGIMRFGELKKSIPEITQRMLTKQLRELEADGLVHRHVYRQVPPKVEYHLKPAAVKLIPILLQMRDWGVAYEKDQMSNSVMDEGYECTGEPVVASMYRDIINA
ncbi:MAG: helix-turn-helix transcriptional regulator [Proteobacteria bacterium]|nr:helix-turn-helix transcriptional regulator [Pseudomonadota bacterium]MBU1582993.1 helix-turn-helix transcriptional regulator [Pseudomonadota bacterium]MBU2453549.1 helix-turn-helix transcriptional regulator [Pseudomonadota bacterium]MBU2631456.1 helix-turn-helix transcriptional regulator [Pseudomonadota bacterium]